MTLPPVFAGGAMYSNNIGSKAASQSALQSVWVGKTKGRGGVVAAEIRVADSLLMCVVGPPVPAPPCLLLHFPRAFAVERARALGVVPLTPLSLCIYIHA
uniref:Uncharacterized protein n=1 Tax=Trypanosoma congolense (strain IL3000) TaxID=1068625 RepID=G0UQN9_TRYCI|nr:hypothetical protein, unlikely [Trypanosoma congolense IL3000]